MGARRHIPDSDSGRSRRTRLQRSSPARARRDRSSLQSEWHLGPVAQLLGQPAPTAIFSRTRDPTIRFGVGGREHEQAPGGKYGDGVQVDRSGHETQLERSLAHRAYARAQVEKRGGVGLLPSCLRAGDQGRSVGRREVAQSHVHRRQSQAPQSRQRRRGRRENLARANHRWINGPVGARRSSVRSSSVSPGRSNRGTRGRSCCGARWAWRSGPRRHVAERRGAALRAAGCRGYGPGPGSLAGRRRARPWGVQGRKGSRPAPAGAVPPLRAQACR